MLIVFQYIVKNLVFYKYWYQTCTKFHQVKLGKTNLNFTKIFVRKYKFRGKKCHNVEIFVEFVIIFAKTLSYSQNCEKGQAQMERQRHSESTHKETKTHIQKKIIEVEIKCRVFSTKQQSLGTLPPENPKVFFAVQN